MPRLVDFYVNSRTNTIGEYPFNRVRFIFPVLVLDYIIQGGDPTGTGRGGESIYGKPFKVSPLFHLLKSSAILRFDYLKSDFCWNCRMSSTNACVSTDVALWEWQMLEKMTMAASSFSLLAMKFEILIRSILCSERFGLFLVWYEQ